MRAYQKGEFYDFAVEGIVSENNRNYIYLTDGIRQTYRVVPYDFQMEWESSLLPKVMRCYVADLNARDLPYLQQSREDALRYCYAENGSYVFKLLAVRTDANTLATYFELNDSFGFLHRLYVQDSQHPTIDIGEYFELEVNGIIVKDKNIAHLDLAFPTTKAEVVSPAEDPRNESLLGFEGNDIEFKSSIVFPAGEIARNIDNQLQIIIKTIAGFQNCEGGKLYIGVDDSGNVCGIGHDFPHLNTSENDNYSYKPNKDGYELKLRNTIKRFLGGMSNNLVNFAFLKEKDLDYCILDIQKSLQPVFVYPNKLFQRAGNMTQFLKGDEITFFIESRLRERTGNMTKEPERNIEIEEEQEIVVNVAPVIPNDDKTRDWHISPEDDDTSVWKHLILHSNGDWSYQRNKYKKDDIEKEILIPKSYKREFLVLAYDNGRVNVVAINDLLSPKRKNNKRKLRPEKKRYQTGWNTEARIIDLFLARSSDLLVFNSTTADGVEWVKIHHLDAISVHDINAQGNVLINDRLQDAEINFCRRLSLDYHHFISGLILKNHQTSGYLGYKTTNVNFKKSIDLLNRILEEQ